MQKRILIALTLASVAAMSYTVSNYYKNMLHAEAMLAEMQTHKDQLESLLTDYQVSQLNNWILPYDSIQNIKVSNQNRENFNLFHVMENRKILFIVENGMCEACIDKELENLYVMTRGTDRDDVILLAKGYTYRYLYNSQEFTQWKDRLYMYSEPIFSVSNNLSGTPTMLVINNEREIQSVYHALKSTNQNFELFLSAYKEMKLKKE